VICKLDVLFEVGRMTPEKHYTLVYKRGVIKANLMLE
jgi:hypothetical protein